MGSSGSASLSVNPIYLPDSIKIELLVVIHGDLIKILFGEIQFVFEVLAERWIRKNFIDMAFSFFSFLIYPVFFGAILCIFRHCYSSLLTMEFHWSSEVSSLFVVKEARECQ